MMFLWNGPVLVVIITTVRKYTLLDLIDEKNSGGGNDRER